MFKKILTACVSLAFLFPNVVMADPIKVESENIVFYGDASPNLAKQIVTKMEIYRKIIMTLSGVEPVPDEKKLTIYAFDMVSDLGKFTGTKGIAGLYTNGFDGPIMLTPLRGAMKQDNFNNQVALHEYSHHVLHGYMETAFPRWYDEGFANYLSTFTLTDGTIQIGRAAAGHTRGLMRRGGLEWVDVEDVVGAIRVYPFADKGSKRGLLLNQFYAQGWLYVHYIHSDKELSYRFSDYLKRINSGQEAISAFEEGFGVTVEDFHKSARKYWYDNEFKVQQFKPKPEFLKVDTRVETLSKAEFDLQMALGQRSFLSKKTQNSFSKKLNSYEKKKGQTAQSLGARASYFISKEDYDQALLYSQSALGKNPKSLEALRMNGDVYFHKSHHDKFKDMEDTEPRTFVLNDDMKKAINYFEEALRISPDDYTSISHMVLAYGSSDMKPTATANSAASIFESIYWDANDVNGSLNLANIFLKARKHKKACDYFQTAKKQAENDKNKDKFPFAKRVENMMPDFNQVCTFT